MEKIKVPIILGPTASGKSALAAELAKILDGEIVNADSMQVYKFMDIGTAKPPKKTLQDIPHHLISIVRPDEDYTAARFMAEGRVKIEEIHGKGKTPFVVGGTGLYIKALTRGIFRGPGEDRAMRDGLLRDAASMGKGYLYARLKEADPASASAIHPNNLRRVVRALEVWRLTRRPMSEHQAEHAFTDEPFESIKVGLLKDRESLYRDIDRRVDHMMEEGFVEEVRRLLDTGFSAELKPLMGLGYKEIVSYIQGKTPLEAAVDLVKRNSRRYAKRQLTWFRKDPDIKWFAPEDKAGIIGFLRSRLR